MSKPSRVPAPEPPPESLNFEEALKRLESVVESMESGELPLEKLMQQYEEGSRLAAHCQKRLTEAELKIERIESKADGAIASAPLKLEGTSDATE